MIFKTYGNPQNPVFITIHGGFISDWSLQPIVEQLKEKYYVITPLMDGHRETLNVDFKSIEATAQEIINYIEQKLKLPVYCIAGFSVGGQVASEILSRNPTITEFAILESAFEKRVWVPDFLIRLITSLKFKHLSFAGILWGITRIPEDKKEVFYLDVFSMSQKSLFQVQKNNLLHQAKESIKNTKAKVLIMVGGAEPGVMVKSAKHLHHLIAGSQLMIFDHYKHGEISIFYPNKYVDIVTHFISGEQ